VSSVSSGVPAGPYNDIGPDGVKVTAQRLDYLFRTGQNQLLDEIMAGNGECTPL
jgi:hypothetical protein